MAPAAPPVPHFPRFRALALFGRRPPQRVDSIVMPASENLHNSGKSRSRPTQSNRWCLETGRRVTLEVLPCGGRRYRSEVAIGRQSIEKCENWVLVRADLLLPPSLALRFLDEPRQLQGRDKSQHKAGSGGGPSSL